MGLRFRGLQGLQNSANSREQHTTTMKCRGGSNQFPQQCGPAGTPKHGQSVDLDIPYAPFHFKRSPPPNMNFFNINPPRRSHIHICIYICICMRIYIYIYTYRKRRPASYCRPLFCHAFVLGYNLEKRYIGFVGMI